MDRLAAELKTSERQRAELQLRIDELETQVFRLDAGHRLGLAPGVDLWARLETSLGAVVCALDAAHAPYTVANFVELAEGRKEWTDPTTGARSKMPYYDGTRFHRAVTDFMVQGGDRAGDGTGTPGWTIADEISPDLPFAPGALAMASTGPHTAGSQFFILAGEAPHLRGKHTIFGQCEPLSVIRDLAAVPKTDGPDGEKPVDPPLLRKVTIHRGDRPELIVRGTP